MKWEVGAWIVGTLQTILEEHGAREFVLSGTFTVPSGVRKIWVTACGGGGGGAGGRHYNEDGDTYAISGSGGNGAEAVVRRPISVIPGQSIQISIGKGGNAGGYNENGTAGGSTSIGNLLVLDGGGGGVLSGSGAVNQKRNHSNAGGGAGGDGHYYRGDYESSYSYAAEDGEYGINLTKGFSSYGGGGGGSLGVGGCGASSSAQATSAGYGGGGGGAYGGTYYDDDYYSASAGGDGYCLIEW